MLSDAKISLIIEATYIAQERLNRGSSGRSKRDNCNINNERLTLFRAFLKCYEYCSVKQLRRLYSFCATQAGVGGLKLFPCMWTQDDAGRITKHQLANALNALRLHWLDRVAADKADHSNVIPLRDVVNG